MARDRSLSSSSFSIMSSAGEENGEGSALLVDGVTAPEEGRGDEHTFRDSSLHRGGSSGSSGRVQRDWSGRSGRGGINGGSASFSYSSFWNAYFDCDCALLSRPLSMLLLVLWASGIIIFLVAIGETLRTRLPLIARNGTSTGVTVEPLDSMAFPAITVCNVVKKVPLQESYCGSYGGEKACPERHVPKGRPNCISYNSGTGRAQVIAKKHGLADSVMLVLRLQLDKYPASARFSGVHVQLHSQCSHTDGTCPSELSASLISAPGAARFFRISKVAHHYNNGSQTEHFEAKDSDAGDHNFEAMFGPRKDTVVLVFYYATLSQLLIRELPKYSWLNLSAEMGGIMGLLFGVGIVNVTTWLLKACFLGKHSLRHGLT